eukprot:TRINITY_DN917_c0_g2_i1.p1 TRINITY_DN917_c0_g2~~TRINITY_DN917_c0_g2_i1.p1  ORF type:complete len:245 (+),score=27.19 TRINITY_DN917_c0_g2_i1:58-792(+)
MPKRALTPLEYPMGEGLSPEKPVYVPPCLRTTVTLNDLTESQATPRRSGKKMFNSDEYSPPRREKWVHETTGKQQSFPARVAATPGGSILPSAERSFRIVLRKGNLRRRPDDILHTRERSVGPQPADRAPSRDLPVAPPVPTKPTHATSPSPECNLPTLAQLSLKNPALRSIMDELQNWDRPLSRSDTPTRLALQTTYGRSFTRTEELERLVDPPEIRSKHLRRTANLNAPPPITYHGGDGRTS